MDRGVAGDLADVLARVLRGGQRDQQGGGGGGGQDGEPLVVQHHQGPRGDVAVGAVVFSPPGEDHGPQSVHLALQPGGVAGPHSVHPGGRQEDGQEGGVRLLLVVLTVLPGLVVVVLLVVLVVVGEEILNIETAGVCLVVQSQTAQVLFTDLTNKDICTY